jgi:hypothetical protein
MFGTGIGEARDPILKQVQKFFEPILGAIVYI